MYVTLLVDVFKNFEKDGQFFCFVGQSSQALTGMYNLNRASQISFPGEDVLHRARTFSYEFLRSRQAKGMLHDKWIVSKDLAGEVHIHALPYPIACKVIIIQKEVLLFLFVWLLCFT